MPRLTYSPAKLVLWLLLALVLYLYLILFQDALIDDAFITLNYVKTLTTHGTWGFYSVQTTNTATSPLNVILLSLVTLPTRSPVESVFVLTLLEWIALAWFLRRIGHLLALRWFAAIAFPALVFNPLLISTLGLESTLFVTLFVAALYFFVAQRFDAFALTTALLTLARPDGFLLLVLTLVFVPGWRARLRVSAFYALALAPWYLFSWTVLGSFLPDTFLIKVQQSWGNISFGDGLRLYAQRYPLEVILSFLFLPLAPFAFLTPVRQSSPIIRIIFLYGALHFIAYALLRVPPYHWYYVPESVCLILLGALALSKLLTVARPGFQRTFLFVVMGLALLAPLSGTLVLFAINGVPLRESFIHTNWASHEQYRTVGLALRDGYAGKTIPINGEVGTIGYYCDCYLLDYAFATRDWTARAVDRYRTGSTPGALLFRFNYLFFQKPAPYSAPAAHLQVVTQAAKPADPNQPHWFISSHWIKTGLITLEQN